MKWIEKCVCIKIISKNLLSLEYWDCVSICHHNTRHFRKKFVRRHWRISILKFKMSLAGRTTMAVRRLTTSAIRQDLGHVPPPGHVRLSIYSIWGICQSIDVIKNFFLDRSLQHWKQIQTYPILHFVFRKWTLYSIHCSQASIA